MDKIKTLTQKTQNNKLVETQQMICEYIEFIRYVRKS